MTTQTRGNSKLPCLAVCLAVGSLLLPGVTCGARASGDNDTGKSSPAVSTPSRNPPTAGDMRRLAEERARVNAFAGKRDPFKVPPSPQMKGGEDELGGPLLPGVRGLVIGQLQLKGIVREEDTHTMIAVVANRANLAYFLHVHEDVYDGVVSRITPDAIYFRQQRLDPAGMMVAREVVLKLGSGQ